MPDAASQAGAPPARRLQDGLPFRVAAFSVAYFLLCRLGHELTASQGDFATFWPASGLFVATLLLTPTGHWRWYALALLAAELVAGAAFERRLLLAAGLAVAGGLGGLVGAGLVRRAVGGPLLARRPVLDTLALVLLAGAAGSALGALLGTSAHWLTSGPAKVDFQRNLMHRWFGSALGTLVVAPALLSWRVPSRLWPAWSAPRAAEAAGLLAAGAGAAWLVFGAGDGVHVERGYLLLPVLGWGAHRFGLRGASAMALGLALLAAWGTVRGLTAGPLERPLTTDHEVQLLLAVSASAALLFAASLEERAAAQEARRKTEALFDAFLAHSPAALFVLDAAGRLVGASRSFERMMGRPAPRARRRDGRPGPPRPGGPGRRRRGRRHPRHRRPGARRSPRRRARPGRRQVPHRARRRDPAGGRRGGRRDRAAAGAALPAAGAGGARPQLHRPALRRGRAASSPTPTRRPGGSGRGRRPTWPAARSGSSARPSRRPPWPAAWRRLRGEGSLLVEGTVCVPGAAPVEAELGLAFVAFAAGRSTRSSRRATSPSAARPEAAQRLAAVGTLAAGMAHEVNNPLTFVAANLA
ncbi:MAG: MASE1 domain-containing protein [Desulfobacterales bacterium]|nr:MASE1 domain-containing protein [Desulfobacterales bacterium]